MSASFLPDSFRCFGHIHSIYARNVPVTVPLRADGPATGHEVKGASDATLPNGSTATTTGGTFFVLRDFALADDDVAPVYSSHPTDLVYRSEWCTGTQHPVWRLLPPAVSSSLASCTHFSWELYAFADGCPTTTAREAMERFQIERQDTKECEESIVEGAALVARIDVDTRRLRYVGASMSQADHAVSTDPQNTNAAARLPTPRATLRRHEDAFTTEVGSPFVCDAGSGLCVYFTCNDGVFALAAKDTPEAHRTRPREGSEVPWSRSPAGCGIFLASSADLGHRISSRTHDARAGARCLTLGDTRLLAAASLTWKYLDEITEARREERLASVDAAARSRSSDIGAEVVRATQQATLRDAREALANATRVKERLHATVAARQEQLHQQEDAIATLQAAQARRAAPEAESEERAEQRRQELARADLRSRLARVRQARAQELGRWYPIELSTQYGVALRNSRGAKDLILGCALPVFLPDRPQGGGGGGSSGRGDGFQALFPAPREGVTDSAASVPGLVATSTEDLQDEATAMGYVAHMVQTLSILYDCPLPHPLLVAGPHSRVLVRADVSPTQAAAPVSGVTDDKLPLSCQRSAERPLLRAALALVVRNCLVLARAMGKEEERVLSFGLRIGAILQYLIESVAPEDTTPEVFTAPHAARIEQLTRALDLLEKEVLWPFFEPVERMKVVNNRAVNTQDVVDLVWREVLAKEGQQSPPP